VEPELLQRRAKQVATEARVRLGDVYAVTCDACGRVGELSKRTWSVLVGCRHCGATVNYYDALEVAGWNKGRMRCPSCQEALVLRGSERVGEAPVLDTVVCDCSPAMRDQPPTGTGVPVSLDGLEWPDVAIDADRQMFQASALGKHKLHTVASFFSERNLAVLAALRERILAVPEPEVREKLLFAFTAILTRASKRYQWSRKRPLNAANQNYYIAPVFYEWNVYDLFLRKVEAAIRSDDYIRERMGGPLFAPSIDVQYVLGSADALPLGDASVDYVFTDPPFGSNIFYSDMNLFQEAWLGRFTDHRLEAVVDRSGDKQTRRTAERYEQLLTNAFRECHRVLKAEGWLTVVFSNSSGAVWALLQRAVHAAGFALEPEGIALLDKGQRSVKGLASGFEDVVTVDLILSMQKRDAGARRVGFSDVQRLDDILDEVLRGTALESPSHVYVSVVRECLRRHIDLTPVSFSAVSQALHARGYRVNPSSGWLVPPAQAV
jgi:hypothetical protein